MNAPNKRGDLLAGWTQALALGAVLALEMAVFCAATARHFAWIYPRWYDQVQYLREAYEAYAGARAQGVLAGMRAALGHVSPQGSLHGLFALLAFSVAGPSRTAALAVNLAAFLALQAATFLAVRRLSGSFALAWAAIGLLAALQIPWSGESGSAVDFRLDWMAACLYGVALAAAVIGNGFRSWRWAVLFGLAVGVVLLTRFLTAVYFCLIYAALFSWLVTRADAWRRSCRLALSGLVAAGLAGWAFWRARHAIFGYYWMGQFGGPERDLRDSHLSFLSSLRWLAAELLLRHAGLVAVAVALAATAAFLPGWVVHRREPAEAGQGASGRGAWPAVLAFLAAPSLVLLLHPAKASQPLEIAIAPLVWTILLAWVALSRRSGPVLRLSTCAAVAAAGAIVFVSSQLRSADSPEMLAQYRRVAALDDYLFFRAEEAGLPRPRVAVTGMLEGLGAESFELMGEERHGRRLPFVAMLPTGLFAAPEDLVMARLAESDFVCVVSRSSFDWPFDRGIRPLLPKIDRWCEANLRRVGSLDGPEFSAVVYERPTLARPPGGATVELARMLEAGPLAAPPAKPFFPDAGPMLWSSRAPIHYAIKAAYSPVELEVEDLPRGLGFDRLTGELEGQFAGPGEYSVRILARNARGTCEVTVPLIVVDSEFEARVEAPSRCAEGESVDIRFLACEALGRLNFIDITDLTEPRVLRRLEADDEVRQSWRGRCTVKFRAPGRHRVLVRAVRYLPGVADPYSFLDRPFTIDVSR